MNTYGEFEKPTGATFAPSYNDFVKYGGLASKNIMVTAPLGDNVGDIPEEHENMLRTLDFEPKELVIIRLLDDAKGRACWTTYDNFYHPSVEPQPTMHPAFVEAQKLAFAAGNQGLAGLGGDEAEYIDSNDDDDADEAEGDENIESSEADEGDYDPAIVLDIITRYRNHIPNVTLDDGTLVNTTVSGFLRRHPESRNELAYKILFSVQGTPMLPMPAGPANTISNLGGYQHYTSNAEEADDWIYATRRRLRLTNDDVDTVISNQSAYIEQVYDAMVQKGAQPGQDEVNATKSLENRLSKINEPHKVLVATANLIVDGVIQLHRRGDHFHKKDLRAKDADISLKAVARVNKIVSVLRNNKRQVIDLLNGGDEIMFFVAKPVTCDETIKKNRGTNKKRAADKKKLEARVAARSANPAPGLPPPARPAMPPSVPGSKDKKRKNSAEATTPRKKKPSAGAASAPPSADPSARRGSSGMTLRNRKSSSAREQEDEPDD